MRERKGKQIVLPCDACRKPTKYYAGMDILGQRLTLCAGCAGEAHALMIYGSEAEVSLDWTAVLARKVGA